MKKILFLLFVLTSCGQTPWLSRISPGYRTAMVPWLSQSNANMVQKDGWWDGCAMAHTREFNPTNVRHTSRVELDSDYLDDNSYKNAWRFGFYYCHINRHAFMGSYTRPWNAMGFKGDGVSFKSQ